MKTSPGSGALAVGQEPAAFRVAREHVRGFFPLPGDDLADGVAFPRVFDGWRERLAERYRAVFGQQLVPAVDDARDTDGERPAERDAIDMRLNSSRVAAAGARPLAFSAVHVLCVRLVDDREQVAADAVHRRFDHDRTAAAVTAASMALPPDWSTFSPAAVASG